jgi:hypothetical protein
MREITTFVAGLMVLAVICLQAAPAPSKVVLASLGVAPLVELVAQGCGTWQDPSGEWHWGHCFPSWR